LLYICKFIEMLAKKENGGSCFLCIQIHYYLLNRDFGSD